MAFHHVSCVGLCFPPNLPSQLHGTMSPLFFLCLEPVSFRVGGALLQTQFNPQGHVSTIARREESQPTGYQKSPSDTPVIREDGILYHSLWTPQLLPGCVAGTLSVPMKQVYTICCPRNRCITSERC